MEPALPPGEHDRESRVVDLSAHRADRRLAEVEARLAESEAEARELRDRLDAALLVRERLAERLAAAQATIREAQGQVRAARQQVTDRLAGEVRALAAVGALQGELAAVRARLDGRDDHDAVLARLAGELADAARLAREDVERQLGAREEAERRLAECQGLLDGERSRAAEVVAALRGELEALRAAHDDAVVARAEAQAARRAELQQLHAASDRLRMPDPEAAAPQGVIVDLARAAERLRLHIPDGEDEALAPAADAVAPVALGRPRSFLRRARVRRLLAVLRHRRA